jgi:hypothetical protein
VLHDLQVSLHAVLQQTPSTQKPLVQFALQAQAVPLALVVPPSWPQPTASTPSVPPSFFGDGAGEDE